MNWKFKKYKGSLNGEIIVPPDKSISHRAIMFGSICEGTLNIKNFLFSEDCLSSVFAFREMGVKIEIKNNNEIIVFGKGLKGLQKPKKNLYLGNSGTSMRIIPGILIGQDFDSIFTGDTSLSKRPMDRIVDPLTLMGADIKYLEKKPYAPFQIKGKRDINSINYNMPIPSAQVKSCIIAAALYAKGITCVKEPFLCRDHTERMLKYFLADIEKKDLETRITSKNKLIAKDLFVPGDISSAAFFIVGGLVIKGSCIILRNVGLNPTRIGIINVLKRMGANINILDIKDNVEPMGDLEVKYSELKGTIIEENEIPFLIDEIPILSVAALFSKGTTIIKGIKELKVKETNRVKSIMDNFLKLGVNIEEIDNNIIIEGCCKKLDILEFDSYQDHRIAMSMAILSHLTENGALIKNVKCVDTSYPGFFKDLESIKNN